MPVPLITLRQRVETTNRADNKNYRLAREGFIPSSPVSSDTSLTIVSVVSPLRAKNEGEEGEEGREGREGREGKERNDGPGGVNDGECSAY
jgi:hypothetical protein